MAAMSPTVICSATATTRFVCLETFSLGQLFQRPKLDVLLKVGGAHRTNLKRRELPVYTPACEKQVRNEVGESKYLPVAR